ncbi:MAG TPA: class II aldolase/adducin family protein [Magnetospirillaceae bacterium]|nr:class II aldolase/adducin family protein [Magnetospirillaceae bacterium]
MNPRQAIIDAALEMESLGLTRGSSGNISLRTEGGFLVTPSGMPPRTLQPEDLVEMTMDGSWSASRKPSSEWRFHRDIYAARPEIAAIVHSHPPFGIALASHGRGIPAFHYMVAMAGGRDIRCAPYATYGTQELSDYAVTALEGRFACLLANHGMIAAGKSLERAVALAVEVESLAEGYWRALQIGEPVILGDAEMDIVIEKFKSYGANAQSGSASS